MAVSSTALGAIITAFDASPAATDVTTTPAGAWVGEIPDQFSDQMLPFVALFHEGETPYYTTEVGYQEHTRFRWEVYNTLAKAEATALKIKTAFDKPDTNSANAAFTVASCRIIRCWRPDGENCYSADPTGFRTSTGDVIFKVTIRYRFELVRSL